MTDQKVGDRLDGAGVTLDLNDDDLVSDYLVIAKVLRSDGVTTLVIGNSEGMDWVTQIGMITSAGHFVAMGYDQEGE